MWFVAVHVFMLVVVFWCLKQSSKFFWNFHAEFGGFSEGKSQIRVPLLCYFYFNSQKLSVCVICWTSFKVLFGQYAIA